jgi:hypothetical protein
VANEAEVVNRWLGLGLVVGCDKFAIVPEEWARLQIFAGVQVGEWLQTQGVWVIAVITVRNVKNYR